MRPIKKKRFWVAVSALAMFISAALLASPTSSYSAESSCSEHRLQTKPSWISMAAVLPWTGEVLVSDPTPGARRLILYSDNLAARRELSHWNQLSLAPLEDNAEFSPYTFELDSNRSALRISLLGYEPLWIGSEFQPLSPLTALNQPQEAETPSSVVYYSNARLTDAGYLVGYGALWESADLEHGFKLGFISAQTSLAHPSPHNPVMMREHPDNRYYLLGYPYIATLNTGTFVLAIDETRPTLYQLFPGKPHQARVLSGVIPKGFEILPEIDKGAGTESDEPSKMTQLRQSTTLAGLYSSKAARPGDDDQLFLLAREYVSGSTSWTIYEVDSRLGKLGPPLTLPTTADHLTIAPGNPYWYVFERTDTASQNQEISTVLKLPDSWFRDSAVSPLKEEFPLAKCQPHSQDGGD